MFYKLQKPRLLLRRKATALLIYYIFSPIKCNWIVYRIYYKNIVLQISLLAINKEHYTQGRTSDKCRMV